MSIEALKKWRTWEKEGKIIKVINPELGSKVYQYDSCGTLTPVMILEGKFEKDGRISNFWTWYNLITKEIEKGYGDFWRVSL